MENSNKQAPSVKNALSETDARKRQKGDAGLNMKVALYCRVSRQDQTIEQQQEPLIQKCQREGWEYEVFAEKISGAKESRTELDKMMASVRNKCFDAVMITKLDRLGRSLKHLIQLVEEFNNKGVQLICLSPDIDTKTAQGMFFLQVIGAVAQLEREMIRERTKDKLQYLKRIGRKLGRPTGSKDKKVRRKSGYWQRWAGKKPTPEK